jgi:hypothetical protein
MNKTYTLRLKGDRQVDAIHKVSMGQNTDEGVHDQSDIYYHLGSSKWSEMANNRLLVLTELDVTFLEGALESLAQCADDNADLGREYRALAKGYRRLRRAVLKMKEENK